MIPTKEEFFIEAIRMFCSSLDITIALRRLFDYLTTVMPVDMIAVGVLELELKSFREVTYASAETSEWTNEIHPIHEKTIDFIKSRPIKKPMIINDMATDEHIRHTLEMAESPKQKLFANNEISSLALPLLIDGEWIGTFTLGASGIGQYKQEHADYLESLQEPFALVLSNCLQYQEIIRLQEILAEDNLYLRQELRRTSGNIVGKDYGLKHVMEMITQTAPRDNPVMLLGETGTGKEVIANAIHYSSPRRNGPFIKVNCGAIPENLIDSELFGHEKGSFTGAIEQKRGRFERASHGTIFLDEIGELPLQAQVRLLRVIQNREIERVGGTETLPVDIRIIAATHRDLSGMVETNQFREDLYYRLNVFPILIPPLRQRKMDIPELIYYFIEQKANELKLKEIPKPAPGTLDPLIAYEWPGNVRELENVVERALIRYSGGLLTLDDFLAPQVQAKISTGPISHKVLPFDDMAKRHIREALHQSNGRISGPSGAAELLGMHPNTLRSKMKKLGIPAKSGSKS